MSSFSVNPKLRPRPNSDGTRAVQIVYLYKRLPKEFGTGVAVHPSCWDATKKQVIVRTPEDVEANTKIQRVQALLHTIASSLAEPTHKLVHAEFLKQQHTLEAAAVGDKIEAAVEAITANDSLDDIFNTVSITSDLIQLERSSFRELMNEGAQMELNHQQAQVKQQKSKIIKRLENAGIYKTPEKLNEELSKEYAHFKRMQIAYVDECKKTHSIKTGTLKQMNSLFNHLDRFKEATNFPLTFANIGFDFYKAYGDFVLITENNFDGYFGSLVKRLRTWLGWCVDEQNIKVNPQFRSNKFKALREEFDVVYLKTEELQWLDEFRNHTTCKPSWERVIDMALVQASIGCRYSDMVDCSWYFESELLKGYTKKNVSTYKIPVKSSDWLNILKKYDMSFVLPVRHSDKVQVLSDVKFNKYLKEVLQAMYHSRGLHLEEHEKLVKKRTKRGVAVYERSFKYELITSHSLRRSFVSRMVRAGYTVEQVALMIGTKSITELQKYFKMEEEDLVKRANEIHV